MNRSCNDCTFWEPTDYGYGKCQVIRERIEIDLITGYEGAVVNYIETESDFGCNEHQYLNE